MFSPNDRSWGGAYGSIHHSDLQVIELCFTEILGILEEVDQWQGEIKALDVQLCAEKVALNNNQCDQSKNLFNARSKFIESVPGYWFRVLMNHTEVSTLYGLTARQSLSFFSISKYSHQQKALPNMIDTYVGYMHGYYISFTDFENGEEERAGLLEASEECSRGFHRRLSQWIQVFFFYIVYFYE